jgi:PPOX class probable F420-dependent enzyme
MGAMDSDEAWARVRTARVGRMATVTPSNRPHVVPFVFVLVEREDARVAYWAVDHKPKRSTDLKRIRNLEANPAVEFVVDGYEENWQRLWWVRCSGTARMVESETERRSALQALEEKYPKYALDRPDGPVVAIDIETCEGWES